MKPRLLKMVVAFAFFAVGCDDKKPQTARGSTVGPAADAELQAVFPLESQQDLAQCRTILQQLDNLPSVATRPTLSATELEEIRQFLQLTVSEATEVGQANFSQTDAAYLEECLLLRAGVRSLRYDGRPALEQAQAVFDWVCRLVYIDDRVPWPAPVGSTMQSGFGVLPSRTYAILSAWQQAGLDGCIVAPASLKSTPSIQPSTRPGTSASYAPLRVCGVRVDRDVFLFDAQTAKPIYHSDGKRNLTLAQAKATPNAVAGHTMEEVQSWQMFLAPAISSVSRRIEWLQALNPGNSGVRLFADVQKSRAQFKAAGENIPVDAWNPPKDLYTATRVLSLYSTEEDSTFTTRAHRDRHSQLLIPIDQMPKTNLDGAPLYYLQEMFSRPFGSLAFGANTPRNLLIRGQFQEATTTLDDTKKLVDNARARFEKDPEIRKDFEAWSDSIRRLFAALLGARASDPAGVSAATKTLTEFTQQPKNRDIERAFTWGSASRSLGAAVVYLMAECVHERAERAQRDSTAQAVSQWKNAEEWWVRFLDASSQTNGMLPARDAHARMLLGRCRQFTSK